MARHRLERSARLIVAWLITLAVGAYAVVDWDDADAPPTPTTDDDPADVAPLRITWIGDADVNPGDAVVVQIENADPAAPLVATLAKRDAPILARTGDTVVVRVPDDQAEGRANLRIVQGGRRSKALHLMIRAVRYRKLIVHLLGGLALFIAGLGLLAQGLRGIAANRMRVLLGRLTRGPPRAAGLGVLLGALTQLTTSSAAFTVGLVEARLIGIAAAVAILVGAQIGAGVIGAVLPIGFTHEGLLVAVVGVTWMRLGTRRGQAIGHAIFGIGLVFYGLHLLQGAFQPLLTDPKILAYVQDLAPTTAVGIATCAATGALLAALLQGPAPVFALVLGLEQASGALGLTSALAILAGANLGAAAGVAMVAWPSERDARPLAWAHLVYGAAATGFGLATLGVAGALADALVPGAPDAISYGHRILLPHASAHLAVAFVATQLAFGGLWLIVLPRLAARAARRPPRVGEARSSAALALHAQATLGAMLRRTRDALERAHDQIGGASIEPDDRALADDRAEGEQLFAQLVLAQHATPEVDRQRRAIVATLQVQRAVEHVRRVADQALARHGALSADDQRAIHGVHALVLAGFDAVTTALDAGDAPDRDLARAREIHLNAQETAARLTLTRGPRQETSASLRLGLAELLDAYEHLGNHLYRMCEALAADLDDDLE
jgi:phosphate:Na+ symporter